ncbi:MAG TPA: uroporphyrinogen-III synthase [Sulfuricurvum sp.]|nr:uroporphyrinogen-III synthase [Sulfuricurvum sp.]
MRPIYLISKTPYPGVVHIPLLSVRFFTPTIDFSAYDGLVFTSKEAIKSLHNYPAEWKQLPCICVSESTAAAAREAGVLEVKSGDGYGSSIPKLLDGEGRKWLYLRPKEIATDWPDRARESGILLDEVIMYETVCAEEKTAKCIEANGILIFTSPSSIACFTQHHAILATQDVVVIGKTTQKALPKGIKSILSEATSVSSCVQKAREIADI